MLEADEADSIVMKLLALEADEADGMIRVSFYDKGQSEGCFG
jgi:hypothetical protein